MLVYVFCYCVVVGLGVVCDGVGFLYVEVFVEGVVGLVYYY